MSRFTFDITYIKGELNKVADCLSQYYESDTIQDVHMYDEYVRADAHIDPAGKDLPASQFKEMTDRIIEIRAMREDERRRSTRLHERKEQCDMEAEEMVQADKRDPAPIPEARPESSTRAAAPEDPGESDMTLANIIYDHPNNAKPA